MKGIEDKSSIEYQRMPWDALTKSINGLVNIVYYTKLFTQGINEPNMSTASLNIMVILTH